MAEYKPAFEVKEIAEKLIDNYHGHLREAKISYLFRDKAIKSKGKVELGKASKVPGKYNAITGSDFIIEIAESHYYELEHKEQVALIDHELSHCFIDMEGNRKILAHDFQGFNTVLNRHGFWQHDLKLMKKNIDQLQLPFQERENRGLKLLS